MRVILLSLLFTCSGLMLWSQSVAYIYFKDKQGVSFDPQAYFDPHTLARRTALGIPWTTYSDLPVQPNYVEGIAPFTDSIIGISRWLNMAIVEMDDQKMACIASLPYVQEVQLAREVSFAPAGQSDYEIDDPIDSLLLRFQTDRMEGDVMREHGLTGRGIRIAVFDIGFKALDTHPAFDHLRDGNRIVSTWDFVGKDTNVYAHGNHGTMVTSCIAGMYNDIAMGMAPGAEFLLARTERALTEFRNEEYIWLIAAEWADKHGADIINSSLGYTDTRYFQEDLDGRTAIITKAANIAARKGILVVNSAGNEGDNRWGTIVTPADSDSVLSVGGTDPFTDVAISFSSPGPNHLLHLKPNVVAPGEAVTAYKKKYTSAAGTSFSAPLTLGFAACILQRNGAMAPLDLIRTIEQSGHLYPYYDYHHGYGVPMANKWLGNNSCDSTFTFDTTESFINVLVDTTYLPKESDEWLPDNYPKNLYYQIIDTNGNIRKYGVALAEEEEVIYFDRNDLEPGEKIRVYFECFIQTLTIE